MKNKWGVLGAALTATAWLMPHALAQTPCVTQNMAVPPGANTSDKAPFFIDTRASTSRPAADARSG